MKNPTIESVDVGLKDIKNPCEADSMKLSSYQAFDHTEFSSQCFFGSAFGIHADSFASLKSNHFARSSKDSCSVDDLKAYEEVEAKAKQEKPEKQQNKKNENKK